MNRKEESGQKIERVRAMMRQKGLQGVVVTEQGNASWISAGGELYIGLASTAASGQILITEKDAVCFTENIEGQRLAEEELNGTGIEVQSANWWEGRSLEEKITAYVDAKKTGADAGGAPFASVAAELADLRMSLLAPEVERLRILGTRAEHAMWDTCAAVDFGMTECEIAGVLSRNAWAQQIRPVVTLVAADDRIQAYRHPTPGAAQADERVMLVLCARMAGLIVSITRIVWFNEPTEELVRRHQACCEVDAVLIANSRVGADYAGIFDKACKAYAKHGFKNEWHLHHQGGPAGYAPREIRVTPKTDAKVRVNQPIAWNPSITGTKTEDTIVALETGPEILTFSLPWQAIEIEAEGHLWRRPDFVVQ